MAWSIVAKAAIAAVFVTVAAGLFANAMLLAGVPPRIVQIVLFGAAVVTVVVVAGVAARNAVRSGADLIRARAMGVAGVAAAGLFVGLLSTFDAGVGLGLGVVAAVLGWIGARVATDPSRFPGAGPDGG
jgi:hypothetical protein